MLLFLILIFVLLISQVGFTAAWLREWYNECGRAEQSRVSLRKKRREASLIECETRLRVWLFERREQRSCSSDTCGGAKRSRMGLGGWVGDGGGDAKRSLSCDREGSDAKRR